MKIKHKSYPVEDSRVLEWMDRFSMKSSSGDPFEWMEHSFLIKPMSDWSREIYIRKSAQIGFSESFGAMKSIYAATAYDLNVIYTFPTDTLSKDFVSTKLDPIIDGNPVLSNYVGGNATIKELDVAKARGEKGTRKRFIYFAGTHNRESKDRKAETSKGISLTADLLIHDESDRSDMQTIDQYSSRIENSLYAGVWMFSNPSYPGIGADKGFEASNKMRWTVRCTGCNHWQYLDWVKIGEHEGGKADHCLVDIAKGWFVCSACGKQITDYDRINGEWVAEHPDNDVHGYWMGQMNYVRHNVASIYKKEDGRDKQTFYNMVLGKPYRGTDTVVERNVIIKNISPIELERDAGPVGMGVDNGIYKHYVIGDRLGIFKYGKTKSWEEIEQLRNKYDAVMVVDNHPYPAEPKKLVKKYLGKVYLAFYVQDKQVNYAYKFSNEGSVVHIQRTKFFDILVDKFVNKEKTINLRQRDLEPYVKHWETMSRLETADSRGVIVGKWVTSTGEDHYAHATAYQDIALEKAIGNAGGRTGEYANSIENLYKKKQYYVRDDMLVEMPSGEDILQASLAGSSDVDWRYL